MGWLLSLYIGATVFGVGVTIIDMMGALGDDDAGAEDADATGEIDAGDGADSAESNTDGDAEADVAAAESESDDGQEPAVLGHDRRRSGSALLRFMGALRNLVYFSVGFGPVGWFAVATGEGLAATVAWSAGSGVIVLAGARVLRRVLRSELTSDVKDSELLMETGKVTVTISPGQIGRVRMEIAGAYVDRYARVEGASEALVPGTQIRVVDIGPDAVIVEPE